MGIIEGLALLGGLLLGPAAGAAAALGLSPALVGGIAAGIYYIFLMDKLEGKADKEDGHGADDPEG